MPIGFGVHFGTRIFLPGRVEAGFAARSWSLGQKIVREFPSKINFIVAVQVSIATGGREKDRQASKLSDFFLGCEEDGAVQ
jgi:hypothetical protein